MNTTYTEQQVYDIVASHLIVQDESSTDSDGECLYRGGKGLSCAIGCLISNEDYDPSMERKNVETLIQSWSVPSKPSIVALSDVDQNLLTELQDTHDDIPKEHWITELQSIATRYNLDASILDKTLMTVMAKHLMTTTQTNKEPSQ